MHATGYRIGFLLEQTLGHRTHSDNLQANVARDPTVDAAWGLIPWETTGLAARLPGYRSNWTLRAGLRARRILDRMERLGRLDAVFIHTQVPAVLIPDRLMRLPAIVSLDATPLQYDALGTFYQHGRSAEWLEVQKQRLNQICFRQARVLVAWSDWAARSLVDDYAIPQQKITVIPPGVNSHEWACPARLQRTGSPIKILFVGGDLARKGGWLLLDAVRRLRTLLAAAESQVTVELQLVTQANVPDEAGVAVYRNLQPNSTELKALFQQSDIFCLPTLGDCLPMVLSEAGAAGLPMVATDVGAVKEIVRTGETGILIAPGSVADLVEALRLLVLRPDLRRQLGDNAAALVRQRFDAGCNADRLLALLKRTADEAQAAVR